MTESTTSFTQTDFYLKWARGEASLLAVTEVTILTGLAKDRLFLEISLPSPDRPDRKACLEMNTPAGEGENYVKTYLPGQKYAVIDARYRHENLQTIPGSEGSDQPT